MSEGRKNEGALAVFIMAGCFVVALVVFTLVAVGMYLEYRGALARMEAQRAIAQKAQKAAAAKAAQATATPSGPK